MTIYEIKRLTAETAPHFFDRKTLKFFGQTLRDFLVYKQSDGRYLISAPIHGSYTCLTECYFNPQTKKLESTTKY